MKSNLQVQNLINILEALKQSPNSHRLLGAMEGILLCYGKLEPGVPWNFKTITVQVKLFLGLKYKETRKQTYKELITELFEELIKEEIEKQENEL